MRFNFRTERPNNDLTDHTFLVPFNKSDQMCCPHSYNIETRSRIADFIFIKLKKSNQIIDAMLDNKNLTESHHIMRIVIKKKPISEKEKKEDDDDGNEKKSSPMHRRLSHIYNFPYRNWCVLRYLDITQRSKITINDRTHDT